LPKAPIWRLEWD